MYSKVYSAAVRGLSGQLVTVEADLSDGLPGFDMVGALSGEVKEAMARVKTALKNCGFRLPPKKVVVNLAPASLRKFGTAFDLPIAAAVLSALGQIPGAALAGTLIVGELGLSGQVRPVPGVMAMVECAVKSGLVELAVVSTDQTSMKPLSLTRLSDFKDILAAGPSYRRLRGRSLSIRELAGYPLICLGRNTASYEFYNRLFAEHETILEPAVEAATTDQILPMIRYDLGLGFIPESFAREALEQGEIRHTSSVLPLRYRTVRNAEFVCQFFLCEIQFFSSAGDESSDLLLIHAIPSCVIM